MSNTTQLIDGYWVIGTNKWSVNIYTQNQAEKLEKTLVNCRGCSDCSDCSYCSGCSDCSDCSYCRGCSDCSYCSGCRGCSDCSYCSYCRGCSDCSYCRGCRGCSDCSYCSGCRGFKTNPERITSPKIGSRNSQTTYYWNDEHEQVVCGCFKGTLDEFKKKVVETHVDNEHAIAYFEWIIKVETYKGGDNETCNN